MGPLVTTRVSGDMPRLYWLGVGIGKVCRFAKQVPLVISACAMRGRDPEAVDPEGASG